MQQMRSQEEKWNNAPFKYREAVAWEGRVKDRRVRPPSAWSNTKKRLASPAFPGTRSQERLGHAALRPTGARSPGEDGACAGMVHYPRAWTWIQCFLDVHWRWQNVNGEYLNFENSSAWKLFFSINIGVIVRGLRCTSKCHSKFLPTSSSHRAIWGQWGVARMNSLSLTAWDLGFPSGL